MACTLEDSVEKQTTKKTYIKEKFRKFNEEVINEFNVQKTYAVPDKEMQNELRVLVSSYVVPKYVKFYERYKDVPFTSNLTKYIQYSPETLSQMLFTLYDSVITK